MQPLDKIPNGWKPNVDLLCVYGCVHLTVWDGKDHYYCPDCLATYDWRSDLIKDEKLHQVETPAHKRPIAYIAGALNAMSCDYIKNVRKMIMWGEKLNDLNFSVFVPGLDLLWGIATGNLDYDRAFNNSQPFLAKADIVFVCPGWENSKGTKRELDTAKNLSVPIYYGDDGYKLLRIKFDQADDIDITMSDEESARDRRRPEDVAIDDLYHAPGERIPSEHTIAEDLNEEARAELEKRIAEGPYRTMGNLSPHKFGPKMHTSPRRTTCDEITVMPGESKLPYMRPDEGTCDDHVGPVVERNTQHKSIGEDIYDYVFGTRPKNKNKCCGAKQNKKLRFIEEANNHSIIEYLKHDPHPDYRLVSVIALPRSTTNPWGPAARFHTYIWELKDA